MIDYVKDEDLFYRMFQSSVESILVVNEDGNILLANPACEKLFGYASGNFIGKNIEILIPEKLKQHFKNRAEKEINKPIQRLDVWGIKKDNSRITLEISISPSVIEGENAMIAFLRDATKRKEYLQNIERTNRAFAESNRKFDTLVNNLIGFLFHCKNNRDYEMDYISEGCLEITGYPFEDFKNQTLIYGQLILDEDREDAWQTIQTAVKQNKTYSVEYRLVHRNGTIKYVWEKGEAVYNDQNEVIVLEGFVSDITAQKELELSLKESRVQTQALLEAIPDMMFIQDHKGVYLDWFANSPEKLFLPPEKFMGENMEKVLPPHVFQKIKTSHNLLIESGKMQIAEYSVPGQKAPAYYEDRVALINDNKLLTIVRDVTEERTKDTLLKIRDNALASAGNSIVIADAQQPGTPIIYCNKAFEKMTGYTKEEALGRNCQFLQNDDRDQKEIDIMKNAIDTGQACNVVLRNYRKDGTRFWNEVAITPIYNENNELKHFIGVQNDVTNKIMNENIKDQTRKILELIAKSKPLKSIGRKIIETVETHLKDCIVSISLLDPKHKTLHTLTAPNLPKAFRNYIEGTRIGSKAGSCGTAAFLKKEIIVTNIETNILWEDYKEIALKNDLKACWSFPILSSSNQVMGSFAVYSNHPRKPLSEEKEIIRDMTHLAGIAIENNNNTSTIRKNKIELEKHAQKLEERVQERTEEVMATVQKLVEANFILEDQILITNQAQKSAKVSINIASEIAKNFPNGFVVVINKNLKIQFAEGEALAQLGLKELVTSGMTFDDVAIFSGLRRARIKENIKKTLSGQHLSFEANYKNRYFAVNTAPLLDENNEVENALHVYSDITHQKETEFTIQNALKKEKELNDLKSRFVSIASHEFRTPLSAILTSAILIGKQNKLGKADKREKYVAQIERNVNNLTIILNDFLSLSKLEEGKVVSMLERFELISFSKLLIKEINPTLKKDQTIVFTGKSEELFVYLDVKSLRHILNNLLSNASQYSSDASRIDFNITQNHKKVVLEITDQGIGIPKEEQKNLFTRFFRAKNAANIEGTGLGLNIVKHYTELMGGTITFESEINSGTTFRLEFPLKNKE